MNFNPRSHERSDTSNSKTSASSSVFQSTLPREERPPTVDISSGIVPFQSTLPREERPNQTTGTKQNNIFQSTLPREERHSFSAIMFCITKYFNPRSHERSDCGRAIRGQSYYVFQSTLPREARLRADRVFKTLLYFNPRSHERSDISAL